MLSAAGLFSAREDALLAHRKQVTSATTTATLACIDTALASSERTAGSAIAQGLSLARRQLVERLASEVPVWSRARGRSQSQRAAAGPAQHASAPAAATAAADASAADARQWMLSVHPRATPAAAAYGPSEGPAPHEAKHRAGRPAVSDAIAEERPAGRRAESTAALPQQLMPPPGRSPHVPAPAAVHATAPAAQRQRVPSAGAAGAGSPSGCRRGRFRRCTGWRQGQQLWSYRGYRPGPRPVR
jgi:hypothetical protein